MASSQKAKLDALRQQFQVYRWVTSCGRYQYDKLLTQEPEPTADQIKKQYGGWEALAKKLTQARSKEEAREAPRLVSQVIQRERARMNRFHPEIRKLTRRCALTEETCDLVIQEIYQRLNPVLYLLVNQISPRQTQFQISEWDSSKEEAKLLSTKTQYRPLSWAIHVRYEGKANRLKLEFPITAPLIESRYCYYPIMLNIGKRAGHLMIGMREMETEEWHLIDPNGNFKFLEMNGIAVTPRSMKQMIDHEIHHLFPEAKITFWTHPPLNCTKHLGWYPADRGQCGPWSVFLAHCLHLDDELTPESLLKQLSDLDWYDKGITIYGYSTALASMFRGVRYS